MKICNKVFVVTGGTRGLGKELVLELLKKDAKVAAVSRSQQSLSDLMKLAGKYKKNLSIHSLDITDKESVEKLPDDILRKHGTIDCLINNAGIIQPFTTVNNLDYESINRVMNTNFYGQLYMIKSFLPYLLNRPESHIVNISSMGGFFPFPGQTIYSASKAALKLLSEGLAQELIGTNVNVTVIFPGAMATDISKNSGIKTNKSTEKSQSKIPQLSPQKAAKIIIKAIERNKYLVNVGTDAKIMAILYKIFPKLAPQFVAKLMKSQSTES